MVIYFNSVFINSFSYLVKSNHFAAAQNVNVQPRLQASLSGHLSGAHMHMLKAEVFIKFILHTLKPLLHVGWEKKCV